MNRRRRMATADTRVFGTFAAFQIVDAHPQHRHHAGRESHGFWRNTLLSIVLGCQLLAAPVLLQAQQNPNGALPLQNATQPFLFLVRDPVVHQDLKLTAEQIRAVTTLNDELDAGLWSRRNKTAEAANEMNRELMAKTMKGLSAILNKEQLGRIGQIQLWLFGMKSLTRERVAEQIGLDPQQLAKVREIVASADRETSRLYKELEDGGNADDVNKRYRQVQTEQQHRIIDMLDDEQKTKWSALLGRRIDVSKLGRIKFKAPKFASGSGWVNSDPLTLSELQGSVVAVHFYALSCINCKRNYPWYKDWHDSFTDKGLTVIGIHTPELSSEEGTGTVASDAKAAGLRFPILVDDEKSNWSAWGNSVWPSVYLVDKQGYVRYWWFGELNWQGADAHKIFRQRIEELLAEEE